jgi:hypothetical protein
VWKPSATASEIAGDLLLATHPQQQLLVEFTKGSLPVLTLQVSPGSWSLHIPTQKRTYTGRGDPPARSAWLVLARDLAGLPPSAGWPLTSSSPNRLRIANPHSGEILDVYLSPESLTPP